jgi:hypothetical protein
VTAPRGAGGFLFLPKINAMECYDPNESDDARETRSCRTMMVVCGVMAVGYLLTLFVWRVCA